MSSPIQISYIDPDSKEWILGNRLIPEGFICTGISGIAGVSNSFSTIPLLYGGAMPQMMTPQPGTVAIGVYVEAVGSESSYWRLLDSLTYAFTNLREGQAIPGSLVVRRPDGTARKINVYTVSGLDQPDAAPDNDGMLTGQLWTHYALGMQAPDPFWEDLVPQEVVFEPPPIITGILPLLPIELSSSVIFGTINLDNDGGMEAYPTWTITGPGTPTIRNNTIDRSFTFDTALTGGQTVQVRTRPGYQYASDIGEGLNWWQHLDITSPSDLWPIARGSNNVDLLMSGSGVGSSIQLTWTRRWLRA